MGIAKTNELAPIKDQVSKAVSAANALQIKTADDLTKATDLLGKIKSVYKYVNGIMEAPIKRAYQAYKEIKAEQEKIYGAFIKDCEETERVVKGKMVTFHDTQVVKAEPKIKAIEDKVEKGAMSFDVAAEKIEGITPPKSVEAQSGAAQFRTIKEVVIEDETKLPREYLVPDMVKIKKVALAGIQISGVKVVEKKIVAGIAR